MWPYLFMIGLFIANMFVISLFYLAPNLKEKVANIFKAMNDNKWNDIIRFLTISYLKMSI